MARPLSRYSILVVCSVIVCATATTAQGPRTVPVPVPPSANRLPANRKDHSGFPAVPVFKDVTEKAGVRGGGFSTGAAWGDYDRDGNVDLFVARYSHLDLNHLPQFGSNKFCRFKGILVQCGPWGLEGESDFLYHNRGDGTFEEVSLKAGVHDDLGYYGLGVMWDDYDDDGWPDLLVANDSVPNYLYHNNHDGTFTETGLLAGVALSGEGLELGNMGVDFGDYDHRGRLSLFVTHFEEYPNLLYRNLGDKGFDDVSWVYGVGR